MFTIATLQIFASEELRPISCENFPAESVFLFWSRWKDLLLRKILREVAVLKSFFGKSTLTAAYFS